MNRATDFAILREQDVVYFDHAASSLTPDCVVDAMHQYYYQYRANVSRGVYSWSEKATLAYQDARETVANFIGAQASEIAFTSGATESINLVANAYLLAHIKPGQTILISPLEHHANMIPWQRLAKEKGCKLIYIKLTKTLTIDWASLAQSIEENDCALIAITHASNVVGIKNDIQRIAKFNIPLLVDGTQMVSHEPVDVKQLGCAFYVFSAHKMYGPTGVGVLYINKAYHHKIMPHHTGGGIVDIVSYQSASFQKGIQVLEPGTPNIAGVVGFASACEYIKNIGFEAIMLHEMQLMKKLLPLMEEHGLKTFSPHQHVLTSFEVEGVHPHDVATILADQQIMVRAGHHCCMPLMEKLGVNALTRVSLGIYSKEEDIDRFIDGIKKVKEVMQL